LLPEPGARTEGTSPPLDLPKEARVLDRARQALGTSPAQALALTQEHATRYPRGALIEERERLAIEALVRLGRAGDARERATRFVASFPRSVHRPRIAEIIGR
jgi:hypothetical protein